MNNLPCTFQQNEEKYELKHNPMVLVFSIHMKSLQLLLTEFHMRLQVSNSIAEDANTTKFFDHFPILPRR